MHVKIYVMFSKHLIEIIFYAVHVPAGQFVHKKTTLTKTIMDSRGRMKAHFREVENKNKTHFSAVLHSKPDVITGEMVPCWNLHNKIKGLIDGNIEGYFKSDVNTV